MRAFLLMTATYKNNNPVNGAGPDISVGKKILALTATSANKNKITMNRGPMFWRKKVIISAKYSKDRQTIKV
jgi:hypothetical protein